MQEAFSYSNYASFSLKKYEALGRNSIRLMYIHNDRHSRTVYHQSAIRVMCIRLGKVLKARYLEPKGP